MKLNYNLEKDKLVKGQEAHIQLRGSNSSKKLDNALMFGRFPKLVNRQLRKVTNQPVN